MPDLRRGLHSYYGYQRIDLTKRKLSRGKSVMSLYDIQGSELVSIYKMTDNYMYMYKIIDCSCDRIVQVLRVCEKQAKS